MPFSTCTMVAGLIPNLLDGASDIEGTNDPTIRPASPTIVSFMSAGCSLIIAKVNSLGFNPPSSGGLYDYLAIIEANYTAWQCEMSRSSPRTAKGERSRADDFRKAYEAALRQLDKMDLSMMGLTLLNAAGAGWYHGGVSQADKDSVDSNTDRVDARFKREGFMNPERPTDSTTADQKR